MTTIDGGDVAEATTLAVDASAAGFVVVDAVGTTWMTCADGSTLVAEADVDGGAAAAARRLDPRPDDGATTVVVVFVDAAGTT